MQQAQSLLALHRAADAAALLDSSAVALPQPESTLLLGRAYQSDNRMTDTIAAYRKIFYSYPAAPEAAESERYLKEIQSAMGNGFHAASAQMS